MSARVKLKFGPRAFCVIGFLLALSGGLSACGNRGALPVPDSANYKRTYPSY
ncbi:MAG: hypothetical protein LBH41_00055 [Rickettsiales bacterium]|jgi:predicted small lipoprotein YifL|nr:hypothetical protein [Rickettsiales bacterium]